jgi:hypothetical protein
MLPRGSELLQPLKDTRRSDGGAGKICIDESLLQNPWQAMFL